MSGPPGWGPTSQRRATAWGRRKGERSGSVCVLDRPLPRAHGRRADRGLRSAASVDYLWNGAVRHVFGAPSVPPSPARRRHAFKVATAWMLTLAGLLAIGAQTTAVIAGALLLAACATVTVVNLCLPSIALSLLEHWRSTTEPAAT
jgi:hypothetical protein